MSNEYVTVRRADLQAACDLIEGVYQAWRGQGAAITRVGFMQRFKTVIEGSDFEFDHPWRRHSSSNDPQEPCGECGIYKEFHGLTSQKEHHE